MKTVYLAGLISTDYQESLAWRKLANAGPLADYFRILDPMRGKEDLTQRSKDGGLTSPTLTSKDIILRDYGDVKAADIILVNLETFRSPRPLIGTIVELGWAWQQQKPVIAIANADNHVMRNHPFIKETVAHYVESLTEAEQFLISQYV